MRRALREHPRMFAARGLVVVVVFLAGFGVKAATGGGSDEGRVDRSELTVARRQARSGQRAVGPAKAELERTRSRLQRAARRDRLQGRTQSILRRRARRLRRALTRARR